MFKGWTDQKSIHHIRNDLRFHIKPKSRQEITFQYYYKHLYESFKMYKKLYLPFDSSVSGSNQRKRASPKRNCSEFGFWRLASSKVFSVVFGCSILFSFSLLREVEEAKPLAKGRGIFLLSCLMQSVCLCRRVVFFRRHFEADERSLTGTLGGIAGICGRWMFIWASDNEISLKKWLKSDDVTFDLF